MTASIRRARGAALTLAAALGIVSGAQAGEINIAESVLLPVKPAAGWALVGDFSALEGWHPAVAASTLKGTGRAAGDSRVLILGDGAKIREELESYDAEGMSYSYRIVRSPLPVTDYVSTLSVSADGDGSRITWQSSFDAKGDTPAAEAEKIMRGVYRGGLDAAAGLFE